MLRRSMMAFFAISYPNSADPGTALSLNRNSRPGLLVRLRLP